MWVIKLLKVDLNLEMFWKLNLVEVWEKWENFDDHNEVSVGTVFQLCKVWGQRCGTGWMDGWVDGWILKGF
jgi:hypothetical protein